MYKLFNKIDLIRITKQTQNKIRKIQYQIEYQ